MLGLIVDALPCCRRLVGVGEVMGRAVLERSSSIRERDGNHTFIPWIPLWRVSLETYFQCAGSPGMAMIGCFEFRSSVYVIHLPHLSSMQTRILLRLDRNPFDRSKATSQGPQVDLTTKDTLGMLTVTRFDGVCRGCGCSGLSLIA